MDANPKWIKKMRFQKDPDTCGRQPDDMFVVITIDSLMDAPKRENVVVVVIIAAVVVAISGTMS